MVFLPARTPILPDSLGGSGTPQSSLLELRRTAFPWPPRHHCGYSVARTVCGEWCEGEDGLDSFFGVMSGSQYSIGASLGGGGGGGVDLPSQRAQVEQASLAIP